MKQLRLFYKTYLRFLVVGIAIFAVFIGKDVLTKIDDIVTDEWLLSIISKVAVSSALYTGIYYGGEVLIREYLWKWIKRELNYADDWIGVTYYTELRIPSSKTTFKNFTEFVSTHQAKIVQNCLSIKIDGSLGEDYSGWKSISMDIAEDGELRFVYEVDYEEKEPDEKDKLNGKSIGYEYMRPMKRGKLDIPILLSGKFHHCATGKKPIYGGSTIFVRKGFINQISENDLPGFGKGFIEKVKEFLNE